MPDKYGYPIPKDTPEAIRAACIPRYFSDHPTPQFEPVLRGEDRRPDSKVDTRLSDGYHPIPQRTRDMYDHGNGHTIPVEPTIKNK